MYIDREDPHRFNLLIATDVAQEGLDMPKCNFVIRYNFVSNEIGSVQSKGRARAPNSECYLIVDRGSVNERREYENLEKEHLMQQALADINELPEMELHARIATERVSYLLCYRSPLVSELIKWLHMCVLSVCPLSCLYALFIQFW